MEARWRKSSYSHGAENSDCVEPAALDIEVGIRDSKNPDVGHLLVERDRFSALLGRIKADELDL